MLYLNTGTGSHISLQCVLGGSCMSRWLPGTSLSTAAGRGWSSMVKPPAGTAGGKTAQHHRKQRPAWHHSPSLGSKHRGQGSDAAPPVRGKGRGGCKPQSLVHQLGTSTPRDQSLILERALQQQENIK